MLVYVIRNTVNGKHYVGKTMQTIARRWSNHLSLARRGGKRPFHRAIRKYGAEAFQTVMECRVESLHLLSPAEMAFVSSFNAKVPNGYNLTDGGEGSVGWKPTEETRSKMSAAQQGKPKSEEHRRKIGAAQHGRPHKSQSEETRRKISVTNRGKNSGERHWNVRLIAAQVSAIREEYAFSDITQRALAAKYGVSKSVVGFIVRYQRWKLREAA